MSQAWDIVELLVRRGKCAEAVTAAERVVGEQEHAATPALNALNAAAKTLRRALMATVSEAEKAAETELRFASEIGLELAADEKALRDYLKASAEALAQASRESRAH